MKVIISPIRITTEQYRTTIKRGETADQVADKLLEQAAKDLKHELMNQVRLLLPGDSLTFSADVIIRSTRPE